MPCYDPRDSSESIREKAREEFRHNSDVAEMLCGVIRALEENGLGFVTGKTLVWWEEHKKRDALKKQVP